MELDDFRRKWQAPAAVPPTDIFTTEQTLRAMLASSTSTNPLLRLRKNASKELSWVIVVFFLNGFNALVFARHSVSLQRFVVGVLMMLVVVGVIVYRRLQVIKEMQHQNDNLYSFLKTRISRFRRLMRLHDYVGLTFLVMLTITVLVVRSGDVLEYLNPAQDAWNWHLAVALGIGAVVVAVIWASYVWGKKEHQRRYGQHLDQLEAALRELETVE
ncbi:hypothetical protein [Hymenobacter pini]|uniref:hypothetical protein n=1 Tax=Hymenobacter pini TaxID=2880879 RepID=UPI001CF4965B|nr:hypothetical protein [Hymenobacter pini]MCA8829014.1 hypothetical protein [Hymenobacter pini]